MVNENTRMYIPEENHQGKAGPRRPARALRAHGPVPAELPRPRPRGALGGGERARTRAAPSRPRGRAENSRPSPAPRPAAPEHVFPMKARGKSSPSVCSASLARAGLKARAPAGGAGRGCRRRAPPARVPRLAPGAAESARAHPPLPDRAAPAAPRPFPGRRVLGAVGAGDADEVWLPSRFRPFPALTHTHPLSTAIDPECAHAPCSYSRPHAD